MALFAGRRTLLLPGAALGRGARRRPASKLAPVLRSVSRQELPVRDTYNENNRLADRVQRGARQFQPRRGATLAGWTSDLGRKARA